MAEKMTPPKTMEISDLICLCSRFYTFNNVELAWLHNQGKAEDPEDDLAAFIASEVEATTDPEAAPVAQIYGSIEMLNRASAELNEVMSGLTGYMIDVIARDFLDWSVTAERPVTNRLFESWILLHPLAVVRGYKGCVLDRLRSLFPEAALVDETALDPAQVKNVLASLAKGLIIGSVLGTPKEPENI